MDPLNVPIASFFKSTTAEDWTAGPVFSDETQVIESVRLVQGLSMKDRIQPIRIKGMDDICILVDGKRLLNDVKLRYVNPAHIDPKNPLDRFFIFYLTPTAFNRLEAEVLTKSQPVTSATNKA